MIIHTKFFPKVMLDNDVVYLSHLEGIISSIDELASMEITRQDDCYKFRIAPSLPVYIPLLLEEVLKFHNMFHIKLDLSKSIKPSGTIHFAVDLQKDS